MKTALVTRFEDTPRYSDWTDPTTTDGEILIRTRASALSQLVRAKSSGKHYSSRAEFPFVPGIDGVGIDPDGRRVYFAFPRFPYGSLAELVPVARKFTVPVPDDVSDEVAAAIANPGMSSWAALTHRAHIKPGETVLINGATGSSGQLAVQIARELGAGRIIATGRNPEALAALPSLGADVVIPLQDDFESGLKRFQKEIAEGGVQIVLDYLWGNSAMQILGAIDRDHGRHTAMPLRFVQIGSISAPTVPLPASVLRSTKLELMGSGIGSVSVPDLIESVGSMLKAVTPAGFRIETESALISEVESAWNRDTGNRRLVFKLG